MKLLFERFNKFLNEEDAKILKFGKRSNENRHDIFIDKLEQLVKDYGEEEAQIEISKDNYGQLVVSIFTNLKRNEDDELIVMTQKDFEEESLV